MDEAIDEVGLLALTAGQVLLTRERGQEAWRIPRAIPKTDGIDKAQRWIAKMYSLEILETHDMGVRAVGAQRFHLRRVKIAKRPEVEGIETRLVRLAQLPKEIDSPDRELLDALLGPA